MATIINKMYYEVALYHVQSQIDNPILIRNTAVYTKPNWQCHAIDTQIVVRTILIPRLFPPTSGICRADAS
jgi:hypothetical protein